MFEDDSELLDNIADPIASDSGTREVTRMIRQCVKGHRVEANKESCDQGDDYMENLEETKKCCLMHPLIKDSDFCAFGHIDPNVKKNPADLNSLETVLRQLAASQSRAQPAAQTLHIKMPDFNVSNKVTFKRWKVELQRWREYSGIDPRDQADIILFHIPGTHMLKEKLETEMQGKTKDTDGVDQLLKILDAMFGEDELTETFLDFKLWISKTRATGQDILEYAIDWETLYNKIKQRGIEIPEVPRALMFLMTCNMEEITLNLVLSELDINSDKGKKTLFDQSKAAVRKYHSLGKLNNQQTSTALLAEGDGEEEEDKDELSLIAKLQKKGYKVKKKFSGKPGGGPVKKVRRENGKEENGDWKKCKKCKSRCKHGGEKCKCPASFHLWEECFYNPINFKDDEEDSKEEAGTTLFTQVGKVQNYETEILKSLDVQQVLFSSEIKRKHSRSLEKSIKKRKTKKKKKGGEKKRIEESIDWCLLNENDIEEAALRDGKIRAFVDTGCPSVISGKNWVDALLKKMPKSLKSRSMYKSSKKVFKFGGGEKRKSLGTLIFPCQLGEDKEDIGIKTEIVDANIPLLLGGATLEKIGAILDFQEMNLKFPVSKGSDKYRSVDIQKEPSGHYSFEIKLETDSKEESERMIKNETLGGATLLVQISEEEWTEKECSAVTLLIASNQRVTKDNIQKRSKQAEEEHVSEISRKEMFKLHHYFGHCHPKKLKDLIQRAGR